MYIICCRSKVDDEFTAVFDVRKLMDVIYKIMRDNTWPDEEPKDDFEGLDSSECYPNPEA